MIRFTAQLKRLKHSSQLEVMQNKMNTMSLPTSSTPALTRLRSLSPHSRILLAEDKIINRKVMIKTLAGLGFKHIDVATDGNEAVLMATKSSPSYNLILMDVNMPFLDGVQATKQIRGAGLDLPIIAMTANALKSQVERCMANGMTGYIAKPISRNLLIDLLLSYLQQGETSSSKEESVSRNPVLSLS